MLLEDIIKAGDRAELKLWLKAASDEDLAKNWVKLSTSKVQDFQQLAHDEMARRGMFR